MVGNGEQNPQAGLLGVERVGLGGFWGHECCGWGVVDGERGRVGQCPPPTTTKELKKFFSGTLVGVNTYLLYNRISQFHRFSHVRYR